MAKRTRAERKARRKKFFSKAKEAVKKIATAPAKAAAFVVLLPFKPMMVSLLKKQGIKPEKKLSEICKQFFNEVVKKDSLESDNFEAEYFQEGEAENADAGLVVGTIGDIVTAIKNWIQRRKERLKEKEAAGETLTDGEKNFVANTEAVTEAAEEAVKEGIRQEVGERAGNFLTSPVGLILMAGAAYFIIKKV